MRVAVVAEWYPSPADPVHGLWAHRQAVAARDAGAEVRVLAMRRPVPPLGALRALAGGPPDIAPLQRWAGGLRSTLSPWKPDGLVVQPVPFVSPPRPRSYGTWGHWMAPTLGRALDRLRREWPFDLVHAHCIVPPGHAAARWRRRGSAALVVSGHGPDMIKVPDRSAIARRASVTALLSADRVIANSRWAERRCEQIAGEPLRSEVVHLGTDLPDQLPEQRERPTIATVAHLVARKRHAVVLHALAEVRERLELDYLVIGDGPGRVPLERLAAELGLAERVEFKGQLEHARALAEARRCHAFVMPSVEEPFGVAYVEAMAAGLPAVGARGEGGPEDIAAAGGGMLLVPPDDHRALARTLEELFDRGPKELGEAARETVQRNFSWERCGRATLGAYERALAAR
ncbi:MAG TPA: glycosyltransferase [Thermoleophilaceae bacterium]|nr:glycosyltransferase [Thermoleophilaceae bacterium]